MVKRKYETDGQRLLRYEKHIARLKKQLAKKEEPLAGGLDQEGNLAEAYREAAKELHVSEGTLEIDAGATVSQSDDGGAYVQAWVWVDDDEVGLCRTCREPYDGCGDGYDGECPECADKTEEKRNAKTSGS